MSYVRDALIDAQEREIERLESENERLDSENASLRGAVQGLGELCDKYKAENAKLRMCLGDSCADCAVGMGEYADSLCDPLKAENEKLRKILQEGVSDQLSTCGCCWGGPCEDCDCWVTERADELRDLGIKVPHEHE